MAGYPTPAPALKTARTILVNAISHIPIVTAVPYPKRPATFIVVSRVGGRQPLIVTDAARILAEVWGPTVEVVEPLANTAIAALRNAQGTMVDGVFIRGFDNIDGPTDFPDPDVSDAERWQFHGDLLVSTS